MCYLKNILVIVFCYLKKKKNKHTHTKVHHFPDEKKRKSPPEKVPSIFQVVSDDSDFALAPGYPVSTLQTCTEHKELKKRDDLMTLPSRVSLSWSVGGMALKTAIKQRDGCAPRSPGTQVRKQVRARLADTRSGKDSSASKSNCKDEQAGEKG